MDLQKLLNKEQYEAAITVDGPLLILAGAGSGKTRVLTYRMAHMIKNLGVYPSQILAITFTNKAAGEMKERVRGIVGDEADNMWISTFHSSCVRILRREAEKLGFNKNFAIYDSYDQKTLIKQCMKELNVDEKQITDKEIIGKIGEQKDNLVSAEQYKRENESNFRTNKIAEIYMLYQKKLRASNAMDFDDLIYKTVELFSNNPDVLEFYQRKFKYIMIDEYQDTNKSQYELVRLLAKRHGNLCVVGDDDQCIYAWRGADIRNILEFEKDYPSAKVIKLEQNYRSVGNILNAANDVIKNNSQRKDKVLRTESECGEKIKISRVSSDLEEAQFIVSQIKKLKSDENRKYNNFAILYRTNAQSRVFEDAFMKGAIPYRIVGGLKFYDRKEIKDILSYLKFINNPLDNISLRRVINVPKRNIGDATVEKVQTFANYIEECLYSALLDVDNVPDLSSRSIASINKFVSLINSFIRKKDEVSVSKLMEEILETTGYLEELTKSKEADDISRVENLQELVSAAVQFEDESADKSLSAFLEKVALVSDIDTFDADADTIVMMTVHSAKGLEFPVVFMVGMENGIFPGSQSLTDIEEMEESRRLCYVGITRAREKLYMTSAERRSIFGRQVSFAQSDFVSEISVSLKENLDNTRFEFGRMSTGFSNVNNNFSNMNNFKRESNVYNNEIKNKNVYNTLAMDKSINENKVSSEKKAATEGDLLTEAEAIPGKKVKHSKFGVGTIVSVSKNDGKLKLTIAFDNMGIKTLMLGVAPLETV